MWSTWKHRLLILCSAATLIATAIVPVLAPFTGALAAKLLAGAAIAGALSANLSKAAGGDPAPAIAPPQQ